MDLLKHDMKGPTRPAPSVPMLKSVNRYSPVTNWNDDPFGADVFEPTPQYAQKKKPPPRPPPPKLSRQPETYPVLKGPTIIRAKPTRPKPPENVALLKNNFGSSFSITSMNVNTTVPIQKVSNGLIDSYDSKQIRWDHESSPEREASPPMPTIPPPPPPPDVDDDVVPWVEDQEFLAENLLDEQYVPDSSVPHAVALFDYYTDHEEDLSFSANSTIYLVRRVNEEWLCGRLGSVEGLFPSSYVEVKVPLPNDSVTTPTLGTAVAVYDFEPVQPGDLRFSTGDRIRVTHRLNEEWYFGECNGLRGQFPANYVQMSW
ncbi:unnamed protein product, partial [Iphiclides podalirius]